MEGGFSQQRVLLGVDLTVVVVLELDRWDVAEAAVEAAVVKPPHPVQGGELKVIRALPGAFVADALGLVEADGGLGERVEAPIDVKWSRGGRERRW